MLIQTLRLKHGWSQQQLAQASGLSVRTVQRIEAGEPASVESLKSLAAVFGVDFASLKPANRTTEDTMTGQSITTQDGQIDETAASNRQEMEAFRHVRRLRRFYMHLFRYVVINIGLVIINLITSPNHLWVLWVIGGWGLGLLSHAMSVFGPHWMLGPDWERREVEKRLGRSL